MALYQAASDSLGDQLEVADALAYTSDVIHGKENEFIHHEKVPEKDTLQPVKGADLVSRVVPLEEHLEESFYSEELAKLLRRVCGQIEEANDTFAVHLASLQLENIPAVELDLPQELIECCAGLSDRRNAVPQLQEALARLASVSSEVESSLAEIQAMLKGGEEKEEKFQVMSL